MAVTELNSTDQPESSRRDQEFREIQEALHGLRFGSLHIVVQDGVVVQIDRTEKRRVRQPGAKANR